MVTRGYLWIYQDISLLMMFSDNTNTKSYPENKDVGADLRAEFELDQFIYCTQVQT